MIRNIELFGGKITIVDEDDYERLSKYSWHCIQGKYAARDVWRHNKRKLHIRMHREIMGFPEGLDVDHINRDTLDNRKENLRAVPHTINLRNQTMRNLEKKTSRFKGVHWCKERNLWVASIGIGGKMYGLGRFVQEENAARAYNAIAEKNGFLNLNPVSGEITEIVSHIHGRKSYITPQFNKIKELYDRGVTQTELGKMYGVTSSAIRQLLLRKGALR